MTRASLRFSNGMLATLCSLLAQPARAQDKADVATIEKIRVQAMDSSHVMDIVSWLTDVYGPRLTWSPNLGRAADWAITMMKSWGLSTAAREPWVGGASGLSWRVERFTMQSTAPNPFTIDALPTAWSPGTEGVVRGPALYLSGKDYTSLAQLKTLHGKLRGAFILASVPRITAPQMTAPGTRYTDAQISDMAASGRATPSSTPSAGTAQSTPAPAPAAGPSLTLLLSTDSVAQFLKDEGVGAILLQGQGSEGMISMAVSKYQALAAVPKISLSAESYGRIYRMLERNQPVQLEVELKVTIPPEMGKGFNVVADIPGSDPALRDQIVMLGGHLDSWQGGTGATDNGAGVATMMEAVRIITHLGLKPKRTIRIALWTGEETGTIGSIDYVTQHFGSRQSLTAAGEKLQAYFNLDEGTGKIRGISMQGNTQLIPTFTAWLEPFRATGTTLVIPATTSGSDHMSFVNAGLLGFDFIQDPIEYTSRTHHTNLDTYERIQEVDMKYNAMILAALVWHAAQRDAQLPKK